MICRTKEHRDLYLSGQVLNVGTTAKYLRKRAAVSFMLRTMTLRGSC